MKIAILSSLYAPYGLGGAEQVACQIAGALRRDGHTVDVVSTCRTSDLEGKSFRVDEWEGIRVWRIAPRNLYWRFDREEQRPPAWKRSAWHLIDLWNPSTIPPLQRVLQQIEPEVVNTHNIDGLSPAAWSVARGCGAAVVHTLHDYHLICPRAILRRRDGTVCRELCSGCGVYASYHRLFQRYVNAIISPSRAAASRHIDAGWTSPEIFVVSNAVDPAGQCLEGPAEDAPLQLVFMSRLVPEKGCGILLRTAERLRNRTDVQFHAAGEGPLKSRFMEFAASSPNFTWHGFVSGDAKAALLSSTDVFLQLSEWPENAPLSLLEAKQNGLYLVATNVGGLPEMVKDEIEGALIPAADDDALFHTIEQTIASRKRLRMERLHRRNRSHGYGVTEMAKEYERVFDAAKQAKASIRLRPALDSR